MTTESTYLKAKPWYTTRKSGPEIVPYKPVKTHCKCGNVLRAGLTKQWHLNKTTGEKRLYQYPARECRECHKKTGNVKKRKVQKRKNEFFGY